MSLPWSISVPNSEKELYTTYLVPCLLTNIITFGKLECGITVLTLLKLSLAFSFALSFQSVHWVQQLGGWEQGIAAIHSS